MSTRTRRAALWLAVFLVVGASLPNAALAVAATDWWRPAPRSTWEIQISSTPKSILPVDVYDIDLFETSQATIDQMHNQGIRVICYFSSGSYENWRPDKTEF